MASKSKFDCRETHFCFFFSCFEYWRGSTSWNDMFVVYFFYMPFVIIKLLNASIFMYMKCIHKYYSFKPSMSLKEIWKDYCNFRIKQQYQNNQNVKKTVAFLLPCHDLPRIIWIHPSEWLLVYRFRHFNVDTYLRKKSCFFERKSVDRTLLDIKWNLLKIPQKPFLRTLSIAIVKM